MKKIMLLGAGEGQIPFLNICRKKGCYVIAVSIKGDYPCFNLADKSYYIDTRDKEKILEVAQMEQIDAIITDQTDVSVPSVAYVAEKMGLRGIGYDTSIKFTDKYEMRKAAKEAEVGIPEFDRAFTVDEAIDISKRIGFPLIIKPTDGSGSRGVTKINNRKELIDAFLETQCYSGTGAVIMESYVQGEEYLVDGFAMDHKYINLDLGTKEFFDIPNIFVSKMCMFSSTKCPTDRVGKMVLEANKKLVDSIGLEFGITHAEYRYCQEEDKVYLIEIAARGGGVFLSSDITPNATGFNTNEALIDYVVDGEKINIDEINLDAKVSAWVCFSFPDGEIVSIDGVEDLKRIDGVCKVMLDDIFVGKKVKSLKDDSGKYGPILVVANSKEECYKVIEKVRNTFNIRTKTENGIKDLVW